MQKLDYIYRELKKFFGLWERPFISFLKEYFDDRSNLIGCEIGVWKGENSHAFLNFLSIKRLYLIDLDFSKIKPIIAKNNKVIMVKGNSKYLAECLPDNLDFVYIDGGHSFEECYHDLKSCKDKCKVIGGHDYSANMPDVVEAVNKFVKENKLRVHGKHDEYWIILE